MIKIKGNLKLTICLLFVACALLSSCLIYPSQHNGFIPSDKISKNETYIADGIKTEIIYKTDKKEKVDKIKFKKEDESFDGLDAEVFLKNDKLHLKLSKWDGEATLFVSYEVKGANKKEPNVKDKLGKKVFSVESDDETVDIYPINITENDGMEFEVILKKKPDSNVFAFDLNSTGLKFYYQPALNTSGKENCNETDCWDGEGYVITHRPENVVGSYAVYHSSKRDNQYKTGKAFHIYRPKIIDDDDDWIWGEMDYSNGILSVEIDESWLDKAKYPVVVDPTFGYTSVGGGTRYYQSTNYSATQPIIGSNFTLTERAYINNITVYLKQTEAYGGPFGFWLKYGIYNESLNFTDNSNSTEYYKAAGGITAQWKTLSIPNSVLLTAGSYWLVAFSKANEPIVGIVYLGMYYDSGTSRTIVGDDDVYGDFPTSIVNDCSAWFGCNDLYSIYANYTLAETTPPITNSSAKRDDGVVWSFNTWTNSTNVNLTCSDAGIGCDTTLYCSDQANTCTPSTTYSSPVSIITEGTNYFRFRSNDTLGNLEAIKNVTVKIDSIEPTLAFQGQTPANDSSTNATGVFINVSVSDAHNTTAFIDLDGTLLKYLPFEHILSNGTIADRSTHGEHCLATNFATNTSTPGGAFGGALRFPDSTDFVDCSSLPSQPTLYLTIESWVNFSSSQDGYIIDNGNFSLARKNANQLWFNLRVDAKLNSIYANFTFENGTWYHLAATFSKASGMIIYINSANQSTTLDTGTKTPSGTITGGTNLLIGKYYGSSNYNFNGSIDEVKIWSRSLSAREIASSYNATANPLAENLSIAYGIHTYYAMAQDIAGNFNTTLTRTLNMTGGELMIYSLWAPSYVTWGSIVRVQTNISSDSGVAAGTCTLVGTTNFLEITNYAFLKNFDLDAGESELLNWIVGAPISLGYHNLNVTCTGAGIIHVSPQRRIKIIRG